jgi:hypothetical protein
MNIGRSEPKRFQNGPAVIDTHVNEHAQLWIYRACAEWMEAESWAALERSHSCAPTEAL